MQELALEYVYHGELYGYKVADGYADYISKQMIDFNYLRANRAFLWSPCKFYQLITSTKPENPASRPKNPRQNLEKPGLYIKFYACQISKKINWTKFKNRYSYLFLSQER